MEIILICASIWIMWIISSTKLETLFRTEDGKVISFSVLDDYYKQYGFLVSTIQSGEYPIKLTNIDTGQVIYCVKEIKSCSLLSASVA